MTVENENVEAIEVAPTKSLFGGVAATNVASVSDDAAGDEQAVAEASVEHEVSEPAEEDVSEATKEVAEEPVAEEQITATASEAVQTASGDEQASEESLTDLQAKHAEISSKIDEKQKAERKAVIDQIAVVVKTYNIPVSELVVALGGVPNPRKGTKAPVTHKDASGNTWTGRGKTPKWLKDKNPDDYRV